MILRQFLAILCLAACGLAPSRADGADGVTAATLHLRNGDFLAGQLLDSEGDNLSWKSEAFTAPLNFPLSSVHSVQFPLDPEPAAPDGPYCFELAGGDTLFGSLKALNDRQAVLEIKGLGMLHVDRAVLHRIHRASAADFVFAGPNGLAGWETAGPANAWREEGGQLLTYVPGATLRRNFRAPPLARYEIELSWNTEPILRMGQRSDGGLQWNTRTSRPNFELALGVGDDPQSARRAFKLEVWDDELIVLRETKLQTDLCSVQKIAAGTGRLHLQIYLDHQQGRLQVFSGAGERLAELVVPDDKSRGSSGGLQIVNRDGAIKLERLTISRWSGTPPQGVVTGKARIHQIDGSIRYGEVQAYDSAAGQFLVAEQGKVKRLNEQTVHDLVLSQPAEATPGSLRALQASGVQVSGELLKVQKQRLWLKCAGIQEPVGVPLAGLHALIVSRGDDAAEAEPPAREGRLELTRLSLHGRLVDTRDATESILVFQPRYSTLASALAPGVSGRLVYRDPPPPPKPSARTEVRQAPAVRIVNGVRTLIGTRQPTTGSRPVPSTQSVLHLRSGDAVTCHVSGIDEEGVFIKSETAEASFVPHEQIKALELDPNAAPVKIEKTKKERLLMLPRMQRENPPTQLIRSGEGDYLRGRLLSMDAKQLQVELRLENKTLPREMVARIIWLHADEIEGADRPERTAEEPAGIRVQSVPRGGNRLTFMFKELTGDTLSGHSAILGTCRVDLAEIDQLLIGDTIEEAAASLAFHGWRLTAAPEPLPTPEGSDVTGGEGLDSALVGKPAPKIELDLLDGKRFQLADHQGKIIVLDFWASWCGPCLQTMPYVEQVAREFADQGVELFTINLEETPDRVRTALERLKLSMAVALDRDGRVAERYGATSIPQTVIIDREGKVARVFVGGSPRFDEQLRQALKSILTPASTVEE